MQVLEFGGRANAGDPLVHDQSRVHVRQEFSGQQRAQVQVDLGPVMQRALEFRRAPVAQRRHRAFEQLQVKREADLVDLAALVLSEQLAGATDLQVMGCEHEAGAEVVQRLDRFEPARRVGGHRLARWRDQVGIGLVVRAADPAAELVQLGQAEAIGSIDHDRVRGRDVDAALDDRRAGEHVAAPVIEVEHHALELPLPHLPVPDRDARLGHQRGQSFGGRVDRLDAVVHEVHLAAAPQLALAGFADGRVVPLRDEGLDREAGSGRGRDQRQVTQAAERHVQRARDRGGRQCQQVHLGAQALQALLVAHPETMLLVDDHQAEVAELHARLQQPVRAHDDVDLACGQPVQHGPRLGIAAEPRQHLDLHGPVGEAVGERLVVLLGQQRRRHQHGHLAPAVHRHERGTQRDLGLAEADVAADDPVHRLRRAQVGHDLLDRGGLVGRFLEREAGCERAQRWVVHRERVSLAGGPLRVQVEQLSGRVAYPRRRPLPGLLPLFAAELVQRSALGRRAGVPADALQRLHRHVQLVAVRVLEDQELGRQAACIQRREPEVAAHAVVLVHDRCAGAQVGQLLDDARGIAVRPAPAALLLRALAGQLLLGEQHHRGIAERRAGRDRRNGDREGVLRIEELAPARHRLRLEPLATQQLHQQLTTSRRLGREQHPLPDRTQQRRELDDGFLATRIEQRIRRRFGPQVHYRLVRCLLRGRSVEQQRRQPSCARQPLVRIHADFARFEHRVLDVVATVLVTFRDGLPGRTQALLVAGRKHQRRRGGQVVEQVRGLVVEQRQEVLDPGRRESVADVPVNLHPGQVAREACPVTATEIPDRVRIEAELTGRQQLDARQAVGRALAVRVEAADAVDFPVEQVDAQRFFAAHREDVEQRSADREFTRAAHLRHAGISGSGEAAAKCLEVQLLAHREVQRLCIHEAPRRQPLQCRAEVGDHDAAGQRRQPGQRPQPARDDVGVWREAVVGQRLVAGEGQQRDVARQEEAQFELGPLRAHRIRCQKQDRAIVPRGGLRQVDARRGAIAAGPAYSPVAGRRHFCRYFH